MLCCTHDPIVLWGVALPVRETFRRLSLLREKISKISPLHILLLVLLLFIIIIILLLLLLLLLAVHSL